MSPLHPWFAFAFAAAALGLSSAGAWWTMRTSINTRVFCDVVRKLVTARNGSRAIKLCYAAGPHVPVALGTRAMLHLALRAPPTIETGDYREGASPSLDDAHRALRQAYDQAVAPQMRALRWWLLSALGVVLSLIEAIALWLPWVGHPLGEFYPLIMAAAVFALFVGARSWWSVRQGVASAADLLLGPMAQAWLAGSLDDAPPALAPAPVPHRQPAPLLRGASLSFEVSEPGQPARQFSLPAGVIKLGRHDRAQVHIEHPSVARMHAVIDASEGSTATLIDLGARAGTMLNGEPITKAELHHGDTILVGDVTVRVGLGEPA